MFSADGNSIVSASSDGTIRVWDSKTTDCLQTFTPGNLTSELAVTGLFMLPRNDQFVVCNRSPVLYVMSTSGQVRMCSQKQVFDHALTDYSR